MKLLKFLYYLCVIPIFAVMLMCCITYKQLSFVLMPMGLFLAFFPFIRKKIIMSKNPGSMDSKELTELRTEVMCMLDDVKSKEQNVKNYNAKTNDSLNEIRQQKNSIRQDRMMIEQGLRKSEAEQLLSTYAHTMDGVFYERYAGYLLSKQGWNILNYTATTSDYGADIIASYEDVKYCIQCKRYSEPVGVAAVQEALAGKAYYRCDKAMVVTTSVFTPNAHELARKSDVELREKFM